MTHTQRNERTAVGRLRGVLLVNAGFSAVTGAILLLGADVAGWLGVPAPVGLALGAGLVLFAVAVLAAAFRAPTSSAGAVVMADTAWVGGALVILLAFPSLLSPSGRWSLAGVTVVVAVLACLQWRWLRLAGV
ncbi:MAG: hypothetical protein ACLFWM_04825 [Actinomycetota bacterium]